MWYPRAYKCAMWQPAILLPRNSNTGYCYNQVNIGSWVCIVSKITRWVRKSFISLKLARCKYNKGLNGGCCTLDSDGLQKVMFCDRLSVVTRLLLLRDMLAVEVWWLWLGLSSFSCAGCDDDHAASRVLLLSYNCCRTAVSCCSTNCHTISK